MPELVMPKMGDGMEEGTILRWLKSEGDRVEDQEIVAEIQTEKASIEIPSDYAGTLTRIVVKEGQTVPVGTTIAEIDGPAGGSNGSKKTNGTAGAVSEKGNGGNGGGTLTETTISSASEGDHELTPGGGDGSPQTTVSDLRDREPGHVEPPPPVDPDARVKASPLARKVAEEHGIDLRSLQGTGPGGRIIEADVSDALRTGVAAPAAVPAAAPSQPAPSPAAAPGTSRPMSPMRKVIARRLSQSKQTIPHFYLTIDVDMRAAARVRGEFNTAVGEERKVSFNDLVIRACALALEAHPQVNSRMEGDNIVTPSSVNIGVAVSLEEGLIVPVVRDANVKSISAIGREVRQLADRARKNQLKPEEYAGGTFSISNLGMYDIAQFQAVINPPEAAILAVGAIRETPIVENSQVIPGKQMYLTISVDHRVVDGQVAAVFLQEVKRLLQNPLGLLG